jgi:hypothetical protein
MEYRASRMDLALYSTWPRECFEERKVIEEGNEEKELLA